MYVQGVYLKVKESMDGQPATRSVTFSKSLFTQEQADAWYQKNKGELFKKYQVQTSTIKGTRSRGFSVRTMVPGVDIARSLSPESADIDTASDRYVDILLILESYDMFGGGDKSVQDLQRKTHKNIC